MAVPSTPCVGGETRCPLPPRRRSLRRRVPGTFSSRPPSGAASIARTVSARGFRSRSTARSARPAASRWTSSPKGPRRTLRRGGQVEHPTPVARSPADVSYHQFCPAPSMAAQIATTRRRRAAAARCDPDGGSVALVARRLRVVFGPPSVYSRGLSLPRVVQRDLDDSSARCPRAVGLPQKSRRVLPPSP